MNVTFCYEGMLLRLTGVVPRSSPWGVFRSLPQGEMEMAAAVSSHARTPTLSVDATNERDQRQQEE